MDVLNKSGFGFGNLYSCSLAMSGFVSTISGFLSTIGAKDMAIGASLSTMSGSLSTTSVITKIGTSSFGGCP